MSKVTYTPTQLTINKPILSVPKHGWSSFQLGDFIGQLSYIDDVPFLLLHAIERYCKNNTTSMEFNEEGSEFQIFVTSHDICILTQRDKCVAYFYECDAKAFFNQIMHDIQNNIILWAAFAVFEDDEEAYLRAINHNEARIQQLIHNINIRLNA